MRTVNGGIVGSAVRSFSLCLMLAGITGCSILSSERLVYDQGGARISIEADPTISRSDTPVSNAHPADLTADDISVLLGAVQVSGWSGSFAGMFESPRLVPLLTEEELRDLSGPLARALQQAGPRERVAFSFPDPRVTYSEDRTAGALFLRGRYLHLVVTDHTSVIQADTGGGEPRDIRDTKGMKLWVAKPAQAATVPDLEEPWWAPFETVHISLHAREVLALRSVPPATSVNREADSLTNRSQGGPSFGTTQDDLQLQIRELTSSNLELRERLDEQKRQMKDLTEEMSRLRLELDKSKSAKPSPRKTPSP